jgi:uncharacterized membrane protein
MIELLKNTFSDPYLLTFLTSLFPIIELKGAIPAGLALGVPWYWAFLLAFIGSCLPVPFILALLTPLLNRMKKSGFWRKAALYLENRFAKKSRRIEEKDAARRAAETGAETDGGAESPEREEKRRSLYKLLSVFLFVAVPLPLTGVWTGSAIAVFLKLKFKTALPVIVLGNLIAGALIIGVSALFGAALFGITL